MHHWASQQVEQWRSRLPVPQGLDQIDPLMPDPIHPLDQDLQVLRCEHEDLPLWQPTSDCELPIGLQDSLMRGPQRCATLLIRSRPWRLRCQHAQVLRHSGMILHDPSTDWSGLYGRSWPLWPAQRVGGAVLNFTNHGNPNLYHWLFNPTLQLLRQMEAHGIDHAKAVGLYLGPAWPAPWPTYVQQTLQHLSLESLPRLRKALCPEYLYMSVYGSTAVCPSQSQFFWLRRRLAPPRMSGGLRLYLGRASACRRRLLNERALMTALEPLGFTCISDPGSLDFHDQCRLLAEADVVVAPHGAALSLLFCCAPATRLLEIHTPDYISPLYAWMAFFGTLRYRALLGEARSNPAEPSMDDLWVDPQVVVDRLIEWGVD